jgi:ATP-binding cassette subfamily B protein
MEWFTRLLRTASGKLFAWGRAPWKTPQYAVIRLLPRVNLPLFIWLLAAIIISGLLPIILIFAIGFLTDMSLETVKDGFGSPAGHRTVIAVVIISLAFFGTQMSGRVVSILAASLGDRLDETLQRRVIQAVNGPVGIRHLDDPVTQDAIAQVAGMGVTSYTPGGAAVGMASRAVYTLQAIAATAVLASYRWWLALSLFGIQVVWSRHRRKSHIKRTRVMAQQTALIRRSDYYRELALTAAPAKEVQIFGLAKWLSDNFRNEWFSAMQEVWAERRDGRLMPILILIVVAGLNMLGSTMLGYDALHGVVGLGLLVIYLRSLFSIAATSATRQQDLQIEHGVAGISALPELEEAAALEVRRSVGERQVIDEIPAYGRLCFRGISFTYPGATVPALDGLDLELAVGESLAIVGSNGVGKTTLVKLLCRMYEPDVGSIMIDEINLATIDARAWRGQIAAIFQDFIRYELTARDNIAFGAWEHVGNNEALERAARRAGILDRIEALPRKWDTLLARHFTDGTEFSGGEWQRIALARALFAVDGGARILIMDEPTASLDARAEAEFYDRFLELTRGLTTIVISHRFSTVRQANRICVLDNGRVAELGSHEELLAWNGSYAKMFKLQSARFTNEAAR